MKKLLLLILLGLGLSVNAQNGVVDYFYPDEKAVVLSSANGELVRTVLFNWSYRVLEDELVVKDGTTPFGYLAARNVDRLEIHTHEIVSTRRTLNNALIGRKNDETEKILLKLPAIGKPKVWSVREGNSLFKYIAQLVSVNFQINGIKRDVNAIKVKEEFYPNGVQCKAIKIYYWAKNYGLLLVMQGYPICNDVFMYNKILDNTKYKEVKYYDVEARERQRREKERQQKELAEQRKKQIEADRQAKIKQISDNKRLQIIERTTQYLASHTLQTPTELHWLRFVCNDFDFLKQDSIIGSQVVGNYNNPRIVWAKGADVQGLIDWLNKNHTDLNAKVEAKADKTIVANNAEVQTLLNNSALFSITPPAIKIGDKIYPCDYNSRPFVIKLQTADCAEYPKLTLNTVVKKGAVSYVWKYDKKLNVDPAVLNVIQKHYNTKGKRVLDVKVKSCSLGGITDLPKLFCAEVVVSGEDTQRYFFAE